VQKKDTVGVAPKKPIVATITPEPKAQVEAIIGNTAAPSIPSVNEPVSLGSEKLPQRTRAHVKTDDDVIVLSAPSVHPNEPAVSVVKAKDVEGWAETPVYDLSQ